MKKFDGQNSLGWVFLSARENLAREEVRHGTSGRNKLGWTPYLYGDLPNQQLVLQFLQLILYFLGRQYSRIRKQVW